MSEIKDNVKKELSRMIEDCEYSSKNHFNSAVIWRSTHFFIGIPLVILTALSIYINCTPLTIITFVLSSIQTFISPDKLAQTHRISGNSYLALKNTIRGYKEYEILRDADCDAISEANYLKSKLNDINAISLIPLDCAFKKTQKGILDGEAIYEVDKGDV